MKIKFDDRLEKYLFFFVVGYSLFLCILKVIDNLGTDAGALEYLSVLTNLFFIVIPLIIAYKLPWEKKAIQFPKMEMHMAFAFLGVFIGLDVLTRINPDLIIPALRTGPLLRSIYPEASINPRAILRFLSWPILILLFVLARKQSLETIGITLKNFKNSMIALIMPFAYLLVCAVLSQISARSIGVIALASLIVGISEELIYRGFPIFRLEPLGEGAAVVITGVLFAAMHMFEGWIGTSLAILPSGLGWGLISLKTRNIFPLILLHMFLDVVGVL